METNEKSKKINRLRGALMSRGLSLAGWARSHGYKPITVQQAVLRYWGDSDPNYTGIKTQEILHKLVEQFPEGL